MTVEAGAGKRRLVARVAIPAGSGEVGLRTVVVEAVIPFASREARIAVAVRPVARVQRVVLEPLLLPTAPGGLRA